MRVVFLARKQFALAAYDWLLARGHEVLAVAPRQPEPDWAVRPTFAEGLAARGAAAASLARVLAALASPDDSPEARFLAAPVDVVFSYLFPERVPQPVLDLPRCGAINFHPGPLPECGGPACYALAILDGLREYGATAHYMTAEFDRGPIIAGRRFPIDPNTATALSLEQATRPVLLELFQQVVQDVERDGRLPATAPAAVRYLSLPEFERLKRVDLPTASAADVDRKARACWYPPYGGATIAIGGAEFSLVSSAMLAQLGPALHHAPAAALPAVPPPAFVPPHSADRAAGALALFTSRPAFAAPLHVGRPNIGDRDRLLGRFGEMLDRRWLTNHGPLVQQFERRIAEHLGVKHCVAMCNATIALEIAIRALDLHGEVIVPSMTFIATAHALQWQQITPVFCDIDPATHTIDPARVEELITPRTTGLIGVHLWGRGCAVEALAEIAARRGLTMLFDAAHAFSCTHGGQMIGRFGAAEVLSFHATKFFNTLEGGAVVTDDDRLARKIRLMKNFGFAGYDNVVYIGTNGKMTEAAAAMGLTSLESLDQFRDANRRNYEDYRRVLGDIPGLKLLTYDDHELANYQYIVVEVDSTQTRLERDELLQVLHAENVLARRYFYPGCHRMEPYRSYYPHARFLLPVTEEVVARVLALPTGATIGRAEIETIGDILRAAIGAAPAVRRRLTASARAA